MGINIQKYKLPSAGWFGRYLEEISASVVGGALQKSDDDIKDPTQFCVLSFRKIIYDSFGLMKINKDQIQEKKDITEASSSGILPFPEITTIYSFKAEGAEATITFDRMINGHMGYNEDCVKAEFKHSELE